MNIRKFPITTILIVTVISTATTSTLAQDDPKVRKDLSTVIALQDKPCGGVVSLKRLGDDDYNVTCKNGKRYRVYMNANNQVVVE